MYEAGGTQAFTPHPSDGTDPTVTISTSAPDPHNAAFVVTFTWDEDVSGFAAGDVTIGGTGGGSIGTLSLVTTNRVWTGTVTPGGTDGTITVSVPANGCLDTAANGNAAATPYSLTYGMCTYNQSRQDNL